MKRLSLFLVSLLLAFGADAQLTANWARAVLSGGAGALCTAGPCTLDNTVIGGSTPLAITGTTITATTKFLSAAGLSSAPTYSFTGFTNYGVFLGSGVALAHNGAIAGQTVVDGFSLGSLSDVVFKRYAAKQVSITGDGTGATTNAGWILGYRGDGSVSAIWPSTITPSGTTYSLASDGVDSYLGSPGGTNSKVYLAPNNAVIATVSSTGLTMAAGKNIDLTAATANTMIKFGTNSFIGSDTSQMYFYDNTRAFASFNPGNGIQTWSGGYYAAGAAGATGTMDTYLSRKGAKQWLISGDGTGATTNAGVILGYAASSGYGGLWGSGIATPSTTNASFLTAVDQTDTRVGAASNGTIRLDFAGTNALKLDNTGITSYRNINTAGLGVPAIYGNGRSTAQTAGVASVATYTVGAADGSFIVSGNVNVTTATAHNFALQVDYTDETNTARTVTFNVQQLGGTLVTAITNVTGAGPYEGVPLHIRAKASTAITIKTTGTFTTVTYNVEGNIRQIS